MTGTRTLSSFLCPPPVAVARPTKGTVRGKGGKKAAAVEPAVSAAPPAASASLVALARGLVSLDRELLVALTKDGLGSRCLIEPIIGDGDDAAAAGTATGIKERAGVRKHLLSRPRGAADERGPHVDAVDAEAGRRRGGPGAVGGESEEGGEPIDRGD